MRHVTNVLAGLALLAVLGWPMSALAMSEQELEQRVLEIADQLRCPTCQAISVKDSEAAFSRQIREKVRAMLLEGKSEEEIKAYFVTSYGEWVLRAPKPQGVGLLLWGLPVAGIIVAGGLLFWRQKRTVRKARESSAAASTGVEINANTKARIEQDLKRFERGY